MLKSLIPKYFLAFLRHTEREMLTHGHEIWSQGLLGDLTKEKENIAKCSHFPHQRADTTLSSPEEKKVIRFMPGRHSW